VHLFANQGKLHAGADNGSIINRYSPEYGDYFLN
jgi:hypothetical protein